MSDDERPSDHSDATLPGGWASRVDLLAGIDVPGLRGDVHQRLFGGRPAGDGTAAVRSGRLPRGAVVDRYVILELLGGGGMGVVYAAYDPQLDRRVALKLLRAEARGDVGRARMIREAHALAKLSHPNVVTVFDAGIHDDEVFLAMELVEGATMRAWLQQRQRSWHESLPVLLLAGHGLAAAHAAGVLHRDFKPENVMIDAATSAGAERVRVMDFGLARRSDVDAGEITPFDPTLVPGAEQQDITRTGALLGTPAYMAAELFSGPSGDARSDQFAFCVTAWEALFGERPHGTTSVYAQLHAVRSGAPPRPTAGANVPGWLQRVLARGLAVDPADRWPSMAALLAELERGRMRMRRGRGLAAALGVLAIGGLGYGGVVLAERQREAACERRGAAIDELWNEQAKQAIWSQFEASGSPIAAETYERVVPTIDRHVDTWRHARSEICMATEAHASWPAELGDAGLWCLDNRWLALEAVLAAARTADAAGVANAVSAAAALGDIEHCTNRDALRLAPAPPSEQREQLREITGGLARVRAERAPPHQEVRELAAMVERAAPLGWAPLTAELGIAEARALSAAGTPELGEEKAAAAFHLAARAAAWDVAAAAALAHASITGVHRMQYREGRRWLELVSTALVHASPTDAHREGARLETLGEMLEREGKPQEAKAALTGALATFEATLGPEHPRVARLMCRIGILHRTRGDYGPMREACRRGLELTERVLGPNHPDVATTAHTLGVTYHETGDPITARALYERALAIWVANTGERTEQAAGAWMNLGIVASHLGEDELAFELYGRTLALREQQLGADHPRVATTKRYVGELQLARGETVAGRATLASALQIIDRARGADHIDVPLFLPSLADAHGALGELAAMRELYDRAILVIVSRPPNEPDPLSEGRVRTRYGQEMRRLGWDAEARGQLERGLDVRAAALGPVHPVVARSLTLLAELDLEAGETERAIGRLEHAAIIFDALLAANVDDHDAEFALAKALDRAGRAPQRARSLANAALLGYRAAPGIHRGRVAEVEAWLRAHPAVDAPD